MSWEYAYELGFEVFQAASAISSAEQWAQCRLHS